MAINIRTTY